MGPDFVGLRNFCNGAKTSEGCICSFRETEQMFLKLVFSFDILLLFRFNGFNKPEQKYWLKEILVYTYGGRPHT